MNKSALMERAVHLALKGSFTTRENPNVGCLISVSYTHLRAHET